MGLLYAGMCGAILFGKVNRVQSHAKLIFSNAVCLQYEEIEEEEEEDDAETDRETSGKFENGGTKDGMDVRIVGPQCPGWEGEDEENAEVEDAASKSVSEKIGSLLCEMLDLNCKLVVLHSLVVVSLTKGAIYGPI